MILRLIKRYRIIIMIMLIILILPTGITFSKYVYDNIKYYLFNAGSFYFNSDKLEEDGITYNINNWGGVDSFNIQFELNNHKNNLLTSNSDITYTLSVACGTDLTCSIGNTSGVIYKEEMTDSYNITVTPTRAFNVNETATVTITATSSDPYVKELSAEYVVKVGKKGISYEIVDVANQPYFNFVITNSIDQYKVITAFDSYSAGDYISPDTYKALSSTNKEKCASAVVTLTFDPNVVVIDTTSNKISNASIVNTNVGGTNYISSLTFNVDATSSVSLRFYKKNISNDYTYPITNSSSVVTFNATT